MLTLQDYFAKSEVRSCRYGVSVIASAVILTALNSVKPLYIDDVAYYRYAAQIAEHPLDPYGFEIYLQPAMHTLVPPIFPYWLAAAIRLFDHQPFLWKLGLFPFCLALADSLHTIFHRFARGLETPLLWMTMLSPAFLPSLNLMLDIPVLALSLVALKLFLRASDRGSPTLAALAGLVAGLAMLTKYTAFVVPAVVLIYAAMFRRPHLGLLAASLAVLVFASWEFIIAQGYGESHFLYHFRIHSVSPFAKRAPHLILPLVAFLGGMVPGLALLGLGALGTSRRGIVIGAAIVVVGYLLLISVPETHATFILDPKTGKARLTLNNVVFGGIGLGVCAIAVAVFWRLLCLSGDRVRWRDHLRTHQVELFLLLWLGLEVAGYFALTPFPAARRLMGVVVAGTVLVGRLAARTCQSQTLLIRGVVVGSVLLGMGYYGVDLLDAFAEKEVVDRVAGLVRERETHGRIWYVVGLWGFQFYAERAGMNPVIPNRSHLRQGDWLVIPGESVWQGIHIDADRTDMVDRVSVDDFLPLSTKHGYYAGRTPMERRDGPRVSVMLYRVGADWVPATSARPTRQYPLRSSLSLLRTCFEEMQERGALLVVCTPKDQTGGGTGIPSTPLGGVTG